MAIKILIPTPLRPFTEKKDAVEVEGAEVPSTKGTLSG